MFVTAFAAMLQLVLSQIPKGITKGIIWALNGDKIGTCPPSMILLLKNIFPQRYFHQGRKELEITITLDEWKWVLDNVQGCFYRAFPMRNVFYVKDVRGWGNTPQEQKDAIDLLRTQNRLISNYDLMIAVIDYYAALGQNTQNEENNNGSGSGSGTSNGTTNNSGNETTTNSNPPNGGSTTILIVLLLSLFLIFK